MSDLIVNGELVLYGIVGVSDFYDFSGFTAMDVMLALAQMKGDITVRINSPGGIVPEGVSIYHLLKSYDGKVRVVIDASAVSIASIIAMAGDEIVMPEGTMMMIHNASGVTIGNADEHRKTAFALDHLSVTVAQIYVKRTGLAEAEVLAMMKEETWMNGDEAVAKGFATNTGAIDPDSDTATMLAPAAAFDFTSYKHAPAPLMALAQDRKSKNLPMVAVSSAPPNPRKENEMPTPNPADANNPVVIVPPVVVPPPDNTAVMHQGATAERERVKMIRAGYRAMKFNDEAFLDGLIDGGKTVDEARAAMIDKMAAMNTDTTASQINASPGVVTADADDRFVEGVSKALMMKKGMKGGERNEFSGYRMEGIARMSLERKGVKTGAMRPLEMVGRAFQPTMAGGMHTTSDFGNIINTVANKSMLMGFETQEETFEEWTRQGNLPDFKTSGRVGMGQFPSLMKVKDGAEFKYVTVADYAESIKLDTYGQLFAITRQTIINDDMDAFTTIPTRQGQAARRTIAELAVAALLANVVMGDGVALFHATHKNLLTGGGSALSVDSLGKAVSALRVQGVRKGVAGSVLNIRPAVLLVPSALEITAKQIVASAVWPGKTNGEPNPMQNIAKVVVEPRLDAISTTAWYLMADPSQVDTFEVAYLDGETQPFLDQKDGWSIDGTEYKVRIDAGVAPLAWEGMVRNVGA